MTLWIGRIGCAKTCVKTIVLTTLGILPTAGAIAQPVPPPPPPVQPTSRPVPISPTPGSTLPIAPVRSTLQPGVPRYNRITPTERIYQAPGAGTSFVSTGRYRVVVESDRPEVLQQVRFVQPDAFVQNVGGRRLIQAGLFNNEANARDQVTRLAYQGVTARITNSSGSGVDGGAVARGYYVIVPGGRDQVQRYYNQAIQLGVSAAVLSVRDRPLGTHLAVGPFSDVGEAEQVKQYLRDRGSFDARLYYDR